VFPVGSSSVTRGIPHIEPDPPANRGLTKRQKEVLWQLMIGLTDKEIAQRLGTSERTVMGHVRAILRRLGVKSRLQAALKALDYLDDVEPKP
jgi:two-component system, NarL family, nitrate/nitrite response regulator NarL